MDWLRNDLHLAPGKSVLDLGAGTGKFSLRLLATGAKVIAVEPAPAMLQELRREFPVVEAREGIAEAIPCPTASMDVVICAQAFHWFANAQAVREINRVLKPDGMLGLIWNVRNECVGWVAALTQLIKPFEGDAPRYSTMRWRDTLLETDFSPVEERHFSHKYTGNPERVIVDRVLSVSFIAALPEAERERVAQQVRDLVASTPELASRASVDFPYETVAYSYKRPSLSAALGIPKTRLRYAKKISDEPSYDLS